MKLKLVKSADLDDWYTIERLEHDGRAWMEPVGPNSSMLMMSCRISDACVEGTAAEMLSVAEGIRLKTAVSFKRCAVRFDGDEVAFWSPRNSQKDGLCNYIEALDLAGQIFEQLEVKNELL